MNDFEFKTEMLDKFIKDTIETYQNDNDLDDDVLFELTDLIVDEWISCSGINGYVILKLEEKLVVK